MKSSGWTPEILAFSESLWRGGKSGFDISIEVFAKYRVRISRAAVIRMMGRKVGKRREGIPRAKIGKPTRQVRDRRARTLSAAAKASPQRVGGIPVDVLEETQVGIPLIDAPNLSCHRVIGPVVKRGVSMVCGNPVTDPQRLFCEDCLRLLHMVPA